MTSEEDTMQERAAVLDTLQKPTTLLVLYYRIKIDQWEKVFKGHQKHR